jgi:hypothetical protein
MMQRFALIVDGRVHEIVEIPDEVEIADRFHADLQFEPAGPSVECGWLWDGEQLSPPPPEPEPTTEDLMRWGGDVIQRHLDANAQTRHYDSIHTAVGYRNDPNPVFAAEAEALFAWRSAVWTVGLAIMAEVAIGGRQMPSEPEIIAALPPMAWPA